MSPDIALEEFEKLLRRFSKEFNRLDMDVMLEDALMHGTRIFEGIEENARIEQRVNGYDYCGYEAE